MIFVFIIIIICTCLELTQAKTECTNYDATALTFDSLKTINKLWYPVLTTRNPENRKCERVAFVRLNDTLETDILLENGERIASPLKPDENNRKFRDANAPTGPGPGSLTYFIASDFKKYLITYSCKSYGDSVKDSYTVYSYVRLIEIRPGGVNFTKVFGKDIFKSLNFQEIEQNNCKQIAPVINKNFRFDEDELFAVDNKKLIGNWIQKAVNHNKTELLYLRFTAKPVVGTGERLDTIYYQTEGHYTAYTLPLVGSKCVIRRTSNSTTKTYEYRLYFDGQYLITFSVPLTEGTTSTQFYLDVCVKDGVEFDASRLYDILLTKVRPNARALIENSMFDLNFKNDDNLSLQPRSKRELSNDDIVPCAFEKISNIYELRYSTDSYQVFDIQASFMSGKTLKTFSSKDSEIVRNISDYHIYDSKRIFRITNNKVSEVAYLYIDENYVVTYEYFNEEHLRLYARQIVEGNSEVYKGIVSKISSTAQDKLKDLIEKMKTHSGQQAETII